MSITRNIVAIVEEQARGQKVVRVTLEIGALTAVVPEALQFCFDVATTGTVLEGAELAVVTIPGVARCRQCGDEVPLQGLLGRCACGSRDLEKLRGEELNIKQMELEAA